MKKEISEFKEKHYELERRVEKVGRKQCISVSKLSDALKDIIDDIESTVERDKELWNPDISTKIKLAKKGIKLSKKLKYFEGDVVREFDAGNISQDIGKRFIAVIKAYQNNKKDDANRKFAYLLEIRELYMEYEASKQEMEKKEELLRKKQHKEIALLEELSQVQKATIDEGKVRSYEKFLKDMQELEKAREDHFSSLAAKPMTELLEQAESLRDYFTGMPGKEEMKEIRKFFSDYPDIGAYRIGQVCEMFDFNEKKLSHVCQETIRFRKVIKENRKWFEMLRDLEKTRFLDPADEKSLDFYSKNGAKIVERIRAFKDREACKKEYERKLELEKKREELSGYSKDDLEAELRETESLLEFLHEKPEIEEGLLSRISSFFKS